MTTAGTRLGWARWLPSARTSFRGHNCAPGQTSDRRVAYRRRDTDAALLNNITNVAVTGGMYGKGQLGQAREQAFKQLEDEWADLRQELLYLEDVRRFAPSSVIERDGDFLIDQRRLDLLTSRIVVDRAIVRDGQTRHVPYFVRMFTYTEVRDWLLAAGFASVSGYGPDQNPLSIDSRRMIVVARR